MSDPEFWDEIEQQYREIQSVVGDIRFPEKEDIQLYQLGFQINGVWPNEDPNNRYHHFYYAQPEKRMTEVIPHLAILGLYVPRAYRDVPLIKELQSSNTLSIVTAGIKTHDNGPEFISAWGKYNFSAAKLMSFMAASDIDAQERANVHKNIRNLAGKFIFAFWMKKHWIDGDKSKEEARDDLHELIVSESNWLDQFPKWKREALEQLESEGQAGIASTYSELSKDTILSMVSLAYEFSQDIEI
ncbi:MAG: hypothetical protein CMH27_03565 [Micavibrio sp.]|nr:hypothetical protein [Micavibrio sp.]